MSRVMASAVSSVAMLLVALLAILNPSSVHALPSYARQTGLACSACHYTPPELNLAGRQFKLLGYVDRDSSIQGVKADSGKSHSGLDLLSTPPLSVMFETSFTATRSAQPGTQNGSFEFPQDVSVFLSGAWTSHLGSFLQITYDTQKNHFNIDNTDVRYAKKTSVGGKEFVYGLTLNNNPTLEDLWNDTPAWGFPWVLSDFAPTPGAATIIQGRLAADVAGLGAYAMWDNHLYLAGTLYRSQHVGSPQPNPATGFAYNIRGVAPYWRVAWQESAATTQFEVGTYGLHMKSTPGAIVGLEDEYTDWAVDFQYDRTLFRKDVLSVRGTYIVENSTLAATFGAGGAQQSGHHLHTATANAEYHLGNRLSATLGWFDTWGTADPLLYPQAPVTGSGNGDPGSNGFIASVSFWPAQNFQLALQYTGYARFNGAKTNYDGAGRDASANNTVYLVGRVLF
jgi:hypothetical protein